MPIKPYSNRKLIMAFNQIETNLINPFSMNFSVILFNNTIKSAMSAKSEYIFVLYKFLQVFVFYIL